MAILLKRTEELKEQIANAEKVTNVFLSISGGFVATIIHTMISLVRLVYDIAKDRKQKSNRPAKE